MTDHEIFNEFPFLKDCSKDQLVKFLLGAGLTGDKDLLKAVQFLIKRIK